LAIKYLDAKRIRGSSTGNNLTTLTFSEEYTTNTGWTQTGTDVTVDSGTADKVKGTGNPTSGQEFVVKSLGVTLSDTWVADFEIKMISASDWYSIPFGLCAGTGANLTSNQDGCGIWFNGTGSSNARVFTWSKVGSGSFTNVTPDSDMHLVAGTQYYARIQKTGATTMTVSIFTDESRSTHLLNSPQSVTIGAVSGLTHIQHSTQTDSADNLSTWEIDTLKIYDGVSSATTDEKATLITADSTGWTSTDTTNTWISKADENLFVTIDDSSDIIYYDLGSTLSDTVWVMRFTINWESKSANSFADIGISDGTGAITASSADALGAKWYYANSGNDTYIYAHRTEAGSSSGSAAFSFNPTVGTDYYFELSRTSSNNFHVKRYTDSTYGSVASTASATNASSGLEGLRYLKILKVDSSNSTSKFTLDDIKIWNGTTTTSGTPDHTFAFTKQSNLPENTLFDETDTYKTWWLQDNTWKGYVTRGVFVGGEASTVMDYIAIDSMGNGTIGVIAGFTSSNANVMQYITIATLGDVSTFGNLTTSRYGSSAVDDQSRGVISGGYDNGSSSYVNVIDYITIGTLGNATAWGGTATTTRSGGAGNLNNNTIGMFAGGYSNGGNVIDYVTIQTTGICSDYGDMIQARTAAEGVSSLSTGRGILAGGNVTSTKYNIIEYMAIGTTGTSYDFGDLSAAASGVAGVSNNTRACFGGGATPTKITTIDYITMATLGVVGDFGDLTVARTDAKGVQG